MYCSVLADNMLEFIPICFQVFAARHFVTEREPVSTDAYKGITSYTSQAKCCSLCSCDGSLKVSGIIYNRKVRKLHTLCPGRSFKPRTNNVGVCPQNPNAHTPFKCGDL